MRIRGSRNPVLLVGAVALLVGGCSVENSAQEAPTELSTTTPTSTSVAAPSSTAVAAKIQLPRSGQWEITNGTISTACVDGYSSDGQVLDVKTGDWLDVPKPRSVEEGAEESEQRCAIVGDPEDPVVVYGRVLKERASGVKGESTTAEVYAMKVKGGSVDNAVDLTSILTPKARLTKIGAYPGGFSFVETGRPDSGNLTHIGLKLIKLDDDLKASVTKVLVTFPAQLGGGENDVATTGSLLRYNPSRLKAPSINVVKVPTGDRLGLPDNGRLIDIIGRFAIYMDEHPTGTTAPVKIMDSASGKVVTTPVTTTALAGQISAWGDLVRVTKNYVVDMSTGKVLLDTMNERNTAYNALAGRYLYVKDDLKNPVIDVETKKTVHEGWSVRPVARIKGWTLVANTDDLVEANLTLVRDNDKGEYPGPWW